MISLYSHIKKIIYGIKKIKKLLEVAKKEVEIAIENGEDKAMEYINTKA